MAAVRSFLSGLVLSAVALTGISVPSAGAAQTPSAVQPPGATAFSLNRSAVVPANLGAPMSLPLVNNLPPAEGPNGHLAGKRSAAAMLTRNLTDRVSLGWNPTTGNILLTGQLLHLEGADRDIDLSWRYNSINDHRPTLSEGTNETALLVGADNSVTYKATDGGTYKFVPKAGGGWTMPAGLNATITSFTATAVTLRLNDTGHTNYYEKVNGMFRLAFAGDHYSNAADRIAYAYDSDGRLGTITTPNGRQVLFEYLDSSNTGQPSKITDQTLNRVIWVDYDNDGRMASYTDAAGALTWFSYAFDQMASITDARNTTTQFFYDNNGMSEEIVYAAFTDAYSINATTATNATTSTLTDTDGRATTYTFNAANQVTAVKDPLGNVTTDSYDAHDNRLSRLDHLGNLTTSTYNPNNTLKSTTSPAGAAGGTGKQLSYTYPAPTAGEAWTEFQPLSSTDSEGNATTYTYDTTTQRQYQTVTPGGAAGGGTKALRYQGDAGNATCGGLRGQPCQTIDGKGNITSIAYDSNKNPATITRPAPLGVITNTFDAAGRVATSKDGKNQTATYIYDGNDRLLQIRYGATCAPATCVTYTYDVNGNLTTRVDAAGTTTNTYDEQNRPKAKTIGGVTTSLTYDRASNVTSFTDPTGTTNYRYDAANRLIALAEPGGSCPATLVFPNTTKCTGFTNDNNNRRTGTLYPNGVKNTAVYDNAGRITSITATNTSAAVLAKRAYTYTTNGTTPARDGALRKTMTTETGAITTYGYDPVNRLTSAVAGTVTEAWTYDANGNRLTAAKTGAATVYSAYNAADQLCWTGSAGAACAAPPAGASTYTYDGNGNTTKAGTLSTGWNAFDQMTSFTTNGTTTNMSYAGSSNTERTAVGGTSILNGSLGITQQTNSGAATSFIRDPEGTLISLRDSAGARLYYTTDALGSTILLTDSTQAKAASYTYDSWGNTTATGAQAATNPFQYAGGYKDTTTGYTKFGARYYDPSIGRFNQPDPSAQETNRYAYAACNPINSTDPTGLVTQECISAAGVTGFTLFVAVASAAAATVVTGGAALAAVGVAIGTYGIGIFSGIGAAAACRN
jgi:RHS repeat-associated protein